MGQSLSQTGLGGGGNVTARPDKPRPILLLAGRYSDEVARLFRGQRVVHLGFIRSEQRKALAVQAADATLVFSREDNAPLVVLESLACGTPIIGYETGGIPEQTGGGDCGFLRPPDKLQELVGLTARALDGQLAAMRASCRARALDRYREEDIARRYLDILAAMAA